MMDSGNQKTNIQFETEEPVYECMFCGKSFDGRSMDGHVRWKSDDLHGERGKKPDNYSLDKCEVVGTTNKKIEFPSEMNQHTRYICRHCGEACRGKSGLGVHIRKTDDPRHKVEGDEIDYEKHPKCPAYPDKTIHVPHEKYLSILELTEDEKEEGFEFVVDDSLQAYDDISVPFDQREVLEAIRNEFLKYNTRGEMIDPVEAYGIVEDLFKNPPQG